MSVYRTIGPLVSKFRPKTNPPTDAKQRKKLDLPNHEVLSIKENKLIL